MYRKVFGDYTNLCRLWRHFKAARIEILKPPMKLRKQEQILLNYFNAWNKFIGFSLCSLKMIQDRFSKEESNSFCHAFWPQGLLNEFLYILIVTLWSKGVNQNGKNNFISKEKLFNNLSYQFVSLKEYIIDIIQEECSVRFTLSFHANCA